ncbi:uncharacterized protein LOC144456534 [Phascolarctos cinereus]
MSHLPPEDERARDRKSRLSSYTPSRPSGTQPASGRRGVFCKKKKKKKKKKKGLPWESPRFLRGGGVYAGRWGHPPRRRRAGRKETAAARPRVEKLRARGLPWRVSGHFYMSRAKTAIQVNDLWIEKAQNKKCLLAY